MQASQLTRRSVGGAVAAHSSRPTVAANARPVPFPMLSLARREAWAQRRSLTASRRSRRVVRTAAEPEGDAAEPAEEEAAEEEPAEVEEEEPEEEELTACGAILAKLKVNLAAGDLEAVSALADELEVETSNVEGALATAVTKTTQVEEKLDDAKKQYLRLNADFDNFRKRSASEKDALASSVRSDVTETLLPLIDNFELAASQIKPANEGEEKINNSYQGLYKQMTDLFMTLGVEAIATVGNPFDPELHDAIMREESTEVADGTILEEFRKGFTINGKLVRPAMVKVAFNDAMPASSDASGDEDSQSSSESESESDA